MSKHESYGSSPKLSFAYLNVKIRILIRLKSPLYLAENSKNYIHIKKPTYIDFIKNHNRAAPYLALWELRPCYAVSRSKHSTLRVQYHQSRLAGDFEKQSCS
jgi:hypothetical protein